jgi:hypothetical protein
MSNYGLYISDGQNGGVITNSNSVTNSETGLSETGTIPPNGSVVFDMIGAGDDTKVGVQFARTATPQQNDDGLEVTRNFAADTLSIVNTTGVSKNYSVEFFRFG